MPLWGRRILVTGPRQYASKLAALLLAAGARPIWLPCIAIQRLSDASHIQALDSALGSLASYDHIAFTSRNGAAGVLQRLARLHGGSREAAAGVLNRCGARIWALGADAEALSAAGVENVSTPPEASTQGLVAALVAEGQAAGARVLCPVPHVAPPLEEPPVVPRFLEALRKAGATAVRVPAYVTQIGASPVDCLVERQLLEHGSIAAIAFSSQAEAQGLVQVMGGKTALSQMLTAHGTLLAAHGPYTAAGVEKTLGLPVPCVSRDFSSFDGLVAALERHFAAEKPAAGRPQVMPS